MLELSGNKPDWLMDMQVMSLRSDDIVVLKFKDPLRPDQLHHINEQWNKIQSAIGIKNKLIISKLCQHLHRNIPSPGKM